MKDYKSPTVIGGGNKKGSFVGNPDKVHIHLVKDKTHVKLGVEKYDFDESDADSVKGAYNWLCNKTDWKDISGWESCMNYLLKLYKKLEPKKKE